eukprot:15475705-Alexandrium_andersonii.AAC.1
MRLFVTEPRVVRLRAVSCVPRAGCRPPSPPWLSLGCLPPPAPPSGASSMPEVPLGWVLVLAPAPRECR